MAKKRNDEASKDAKSYTEIVKEIAQLDNVAVDVEDIDFFQDLTQKFEDKDVAIIIEVFLQKFVGLNRTVICRSIDNAIPEFINNSESLTQDTFKALINYLWVIKKSHKVFSKEYLTAHCIDFLNLIINEGCRQGTDKLYKDKNNIITFGKIIKNVRGEK